MILSLDIGNTQIYGGVFENQKETDKICFTFRKNAKESFSSDEMGLFLRTVLRENDINPSEIKKIAFCSVVPDIIYSLRSACQKYFKINPFILQSGVKTGLRIKYRNPLEVGSDRMANAVAASVLFPNRDLIIVDLGTATTFCAVSATKDYLGGTIIAGVKLSMKSLETNTAKLSSVEIIKRNQTLGLSTTESLQSGLFYGHLGAMREIIGRLSEECFNKKSVFVVGTGSFPLLFENENIFHVIIPDLVLRGNVIALNLYSEGRS